MARRIPRFHFLIEGAFRVPPFFIVDEILKSSFVFPVNVEELKNDENSTAIQTVDGDSFIAAYVSTILLYLLRFIPILIGCSIILSIVALKRKELISVYSFFTSMFTLYFSYRRNIIFLNYFLVTDTLIETHSIDLGAFDSIGFAFVQILLIQSSLGFVFHYLNPVGLRNNWFSKIALISFLSPSILALLPFPRWFLKILPFNSLLLLLSISTFKFWSNIPAISKKIEDSWKFCRSLITEFGMPAVKAVLVKWFILHLTAALRIFFITRLLIHAINFIVANYSEHGITSLPILIQLVKSLLTSGCETFMAIVGMASCISYFFLQISNVFQSVLLVDNRHKYMGMFSGLIFCILALQTGLTNLVPEQRIIWLEHCILLLFSVLLRRIHTMLNPILLSLSALHNVELHRHIRALLVSAFLIFYPAGVLVYLWRDTAMSRWDFILSTFNLRIIVKISISLTIYFIFIVDFFRKTFWERLDDYVYYLDVLGSAFDLVFGIRILFNAAWTLFFVSGSVIRVTAMCLHSYYNIWFVAKASWSSFIKRRMAVKKIDQLQDAGTSELAELKDICAICFEPMEAAKITSCRHFYHAICLRKWQYVQDFCPICRQKLFPHEKA